MTQAIKETKKPSLTAQAYELLRHEIVSCAMPPGLDISEAELAARFNMSKTPVREALMRLRNDGFVETFPRRGYRVLPATIADMNELIDARIVLEGGAAAFAAARITEAQLDELDRLAEATYERDEDATLQSFIEANRDFHNAIARATGNGRLERMIALNVQELERFFYLGARARDITSETKSDHHAIVDVLRKRDPEAAREVTVAHNNATRQGLLESIARGDISRAINLI